MNLTYLRYDMMRSLREISGLIFGIGLPIGLYVMFGVLPDYATQRIPQWNGNVSAVTMISMALYGAMTMGGTLSAESAAEFKRGWGRQLALTPMSATQYVLTKTAGIQLLAALPIVCTFLVGSATNAELDGAGWLTAGLLAWVTILPVNLIGLGLGSLLRSDAAERVVAGALVVFGFLGNLFMPLSGTMLEIARFTPLYAANALSRYPANNGWNIDNMGQIGLHESWPMALANFAIWTLLSALFAIYAVRRPQEK